MLHWLSGFSSAALLQRQTPDGPPATFARQFTPATSYKEWHGEPSEMLQQYLARLYQPGLAAQLYRVACEYWGYWDSCGSAAILAEHVADTQAATGNANAAMRKVAVPRLRSGDRIWRCASHRCRAAQSRAQTALYTGAASGSGRGRGADGGDLIYGDAYDRYADYPTNRTPKRRKGMARTPVKSIVSAAVAALSLSGMATAAESNALRGIDLRAYEQRIARDDRDAGPAIRAIAVCEMGFRTKELANPGAACGVAYEYATREKKHEQALRYAALGCEKHKSVESCRNVGALPLWMGNQGITVPVSFKAELKRVAEFVCYSGARIKAINGVDVTGRECGYLARRFNLARDPEYAFALEPAARRFFEAIYEPSLAGKLYMAACKRLGSTDGCQVARSFGQPVNEAQRALPKVKG